MLKLYYYTLFLLIIIDVEPVGILAMACDDDSTNDHVFYLLVSGFRGRERTLARNDCCHR